MIKVLLAGLGNMGTSHALAHHYHPDSQIVGLVSRSGVVNHPGLRHYPVYTDYQDALKRLCPDLVVIATYSDTHADYASLAMQAGAHIFVEKPLATKIEDARCVVEMAEKLQRKLVIGYILRHHPSWIRFIKEARALGGPYVFRMNLNQQSKGSEWETHKALMQTTSPLVDCGVHYVDVWCQITDAKPLSVHGIGLRLSNEIPSDMYNYGQLQLVFDDDSVGWYEAGWGPMMSETAFFVKDIISPAGSVSIIDADKSDSSDIDGHTKVGKILVHRPTGERWIDLADEPSHQQLCDREQAFMLRAIKDDLNLTKDMQDALQSLAICLAADEAIRSCRTVCIREI